MTITPEMQALWNEVKANSKRLEDCPGPHAFVGCEDEPYVMVTIGTQKLYRRFVCTKCRGKIYAHDKLWYERGLEHGRKESK